MKEKNQTPFRNTECSKSLPSAIEKIVTWSRINSPWAIHFNSGSCNGCDIELLEVVTPCHDVERLGIKLQGSPRHADVLIVTGAVTLQSRSRLLRTYEQMPGPKFVLALGSCGISGGVFHDCYSVMGGVDKVIPVDIYIPGCPPRPEAIMNGVVQLLEKLKGVKDPQFDQPRIFAKSVPEPAQSAKEKSQPAADEKPQNGDKSS